MIQILNGIKKKDCWKMLNIGLAFFSVVAINSNFSTLIFCKGTSKLEISK